MSNEHNIPSDICTITENNLEAVLFSEFSGTENMIVASDTINNLSELDGALCYDETTNELLYVNMIQPNLNAPDSLVNASQSVFNALAGLSTLADVTTFNDGNPVMLLANGSIVIPNDDDSLVSTHTDPFILQFVQSSPDSSTKEPALSAPTPTEKSSGSVFISDDKSSESAPNVTTDLKETCKIIEVDDILNDTPVIYKCELCSKNFSRNKEYRAHLATHKDKVHKCSHCGNSFNKLKNLILHEALHNPNETICPLVNCQKRFRRLASLKAHIKLHEEEETLTCTECGEEFRNQMHLELHYKYQPQCRLTFNKGNDPLGDSESKSCKLCNRKFLNASTLAAHKKEHEKIKKALATKSHRKKTSSSKSSSRMNRCKVCPKWFFKPSQLIRHMRIHTGERPFECSECHKAFNQANSLKIHMLKHTGDRPYQCPFCPSGFSQRGNLRQHINRVHSIPKVEDLVYECSECPCIFKKICSLNAHRNRVHRKGYKLVLSPEELENDPYESGQQTSPISSSPYRLDEGTDDQCEVAAEDRNDNRTYACSECTKSFKTVNALKTHLNEAHVQLPIPQDEQENSITLENNLDDLDEEEMGRLLRKQTTVNTITISVDRGGGELWNQKVFIKKKGNRQSYQCSHCPKESVKLNEMIRHVKINVVGKVFKCEYCSKTFSQHSTFKTHLSLHANAQTYQCQTCQEKFSNPAELNAHSKSHAQVIDLMCVTCMKTYSSEEKETHRCFSTKTLLDFAMDDVVKLNTPVGPVESHDVQHLHDKVNLILPPYTCTRCDITFKSYGKLKSHLLDHDRKACNLCRSGFENEEKLTQHINSVHKNNGKTPAKEECLKCGRHYKNTKILAQHTRKAHPENLESNGSNSNNERINSALNVNVDDDILTKNLAVNATPLENNVDPRNDVPKFCVPDDLNVHRTVDYPIVLDTGMSLENGSTNESAPVPANHDQISSCDRVNMLDNTNELVLSMRNEVPYLMTRESLDDCFRDSEVNTLPVTDTPNAVDSNDVFDVAGDIIYKCTSCSQQYYTEAHLQKHFQESEICHNGMPDMMFHYFYACNTCYLTFKTLNSFLRHLQTHSGAGMYTCVYCDQPNKTEAELTQHIAAHSLKKEYPCVHCGELAESAEAVKKHITDIHLMSSADSNVLETRRKKTISSELLLTEKEKSILVDQLPNKYSSISEKVLSSLLKKNIRKKSEDETNEIPPETETIKGKKKRTATKENRCNYCDRSFKKMCDLIRHIRIHTGEKPFKCDYCNKCFTVKSILNCHLKTHFTVKNVFCHICNRFFSTVGSLKIHMRLHTGDRPYKCLYCKESFRTSGHRDSHQKRHLGEKDKARMVAMEASMAELEAQENLELSLSDAINLHDGNFLISEITDIEDFKFQEDTSLDLVGIESISNPNECSICGKYFKKKTDLEKHISVHSSGRQTKCDQSKKTRAKCNAPSSSKQCEVCQKTFASAKNLKTHRARQHPGVLELPFPVDSESLLLSDARIRPDIVEPNDTNSRLENSNEDKSDKWVEEENLNLSLVVGKNRKTDTLNDFFIMEKQFDLNSMISDFFPDDER